MRRNEAGEGKLGSIIWLLVLVGVGMAIWNVGPVYMANYTFNDKLNQIARSPRYRATDERIMNDIMKAVSEEKLENFVTRQSCKVNTMETRRTIACAYERTVNVFPGWTHTFQFKNDADQPLI
jgi:hypothetical protein